MPDPILAPAIAIQLASPRRSGPRFVATLRSRFAPPAPSRIAAAILVVLLAGSLVATFSPLRARAGRLPLVARSGTPAAPQGVMERTLLNLTLTDIPTYHAQLGIPAVSFPPGSMAELDSGTGPNLVSVAEGPIQLSVVKAAHPVRVLRPGTTDLLEGEAIAAGQEVSLDTGATLVVAEGSTFELRNTGSGTARLLWLLGATDSRLNTREGAAWEGSSNGGTIFDLTGPFSIVLTQETLDPDETLPGEASGETHQVVATLDPQRVADMRTGTNGAVRNASDEPLEVYVLTVTSGAGIATPAA